MYKLLKHRCKYRAINDLRNKKVHCRLQYPKLVFISLVNVPHKILNYLYAIKPLNDRHIGTKELVRNFRYSEMKFAIIQALEKLFIT